MKRTALLLALSVVGCAHATDSEVIAVAEKPQTIAAIDTVDTTRLLPEGQGTAEAAQRALAELLAAHLGTVGIVRAPVAPDAVVADLPAPGWAVRARLVMKPELFCLVTLEPIATQPKEQAVAAAPWSVLDAWDQVHRGLIQLAPPKLPPLPPDRFARLRAEATAAVQHDPPLTIVEYKRAPRPITDAPDRPYYTPPTEDSGLRAKP
jgi:hypothetical protein